MKNKLFGCLSVTIVISAAFAGPTSGAVIGGSGVSGYSYTGAFNLTPGSFSLKKFDSSLGTLTGVRITLSLSDVLGSYSFTNTGNFTLRHPSSAGLSTNLSAGLLELTATTARQTLTPGSNLVYTANTNPTVTPGVAASASEYSEFDGQWAADNGFIGEDNVTVSYSSVSSTLIDATGTYTLNPTINGNIDAFVTYTYDEVAAVPEPSEFLLGGVPALFGGWVLMRRRRGVRQDLV